MVLYTIWLFNIAMENDAFIDGLPIKNCDFPVLYVKWPDGKYLRYHLYIIPSIYNIY